MQDLEIATRWSMSFSVRSYIISLVGRKSGLGILYRPWRLIMPIIWSAVLFAVAGLCEVGGGYLVWQWLRQGRGAMWGLVGAVVLVLYGVVPTLQPEVQFGRVYAAYGGVFIVLSLVWGWYFDQWRPDRWDLAGAGLALAGAGIIMWAPRG